MAEDQINFDSLEIAPMEKGMAGGAFSDVDGEFKHLANWFRTRAFDSQRVRKSKTYVAKLEGVIVGYVTISILTVESIPDEQNDGPFQYQAMKLGKLLVSPSYRSRGIGAILLKFAIDIALSLNDLVGCRGIFVDANNNDRTIHFYENHGFAVVEEAQGASDTTLMLFKLA